MWTDHGAGSGLNVPVVWPTGHVSKCGGDYSVSAALSCRLRGPLREIHGILTREYVA